MEKTTKTIITIPVYNGELFIERSLKSCLTQTVKTDIWVIDNRSTDNTIKIVEEFKKQHPQIKLFINEKNLGRVGNWNRCLDLFEKSNYDYIKFLFAGDELYPDCIKETEKAFLSDDEIGAVASNYDFVNLDGNRNQSLHKCVDRPLAVKEITKINLESGGILGAIVSNAYNKRFINGYRFSEFFIGKSDFDYEILSRSKAYYIGKVLSRFNLDAHRTFFKAKSYLVEFEYAFNRAYRLEKVKEMFSEQEYVNIKEKILLETFSRNFPYYNRKTFVKLSVIIVMKLVRNFAGNLKRDLGNIFQLK